MNKNKILDKASELAGNEHDWVDFKQDYWIAGRPDKRSEFIKDIAALSNTRTDRDTHYIFIGFGNDGSVIPVDPDETISEGRRHIVDFDEADLQQKLREALDPEPEFVYYEYEHSEGIIALLAIYPRQTPLVVKCDVNDEYSNTLIPEGTVFVRQGSSTVIAKGNELEDFIQHRVEQGKQRIMEAIENAIELGPDMVERLGNSSNAEPFIGISDDSRAQTTVDEKLTREPISDLNKQLNTDIATSIKREDELLSAAATWEYYVNPEEIAIDSESIEFLTRCAINNRAYGMFWLEKLNTIDNVADVLINNPFDYHELKKVSKILVLIGQSETYELFKSECDFNAGVGEFAKDEDTVSYDIDKRIAYLTESDDYDIDVYEFSEKYNLDDMNSDDLRTAIPDVCDTLKDVQEEYASGNWNMRGKRDKLRKILRDLEVYLGKEELI